MATQAIKCELASGDVYFYDDEVVEVEERPNENIAVHRNQTSDFHLYSFSSQYMSLYITLRDVRSGLRSRFDQLFDENAEFTIYTNLLWDNTESYNVILIPEKVDLSYFMGEREGDLVISFQLLESSK